MSTSRLLFKNSEEDVEKVLTIFHKTPKVLEESVIAIKEWLKKQPHLPEVNNDGIIKSFLSLSEYGIEEAKLLLDFYFTFRSTFPTLFKHPLSKEMLDVTEVLYFLPLPSPPDEYKIIVYAKLKNCDPDVFNWSKLIAYIFNVLELVIAEDYCTSTLLLWDMEGMKLAHLGKVDFSVFKKIHLVSERLLRKKTKRIFIFNAPSGWETLLKPIFAILSKSMKVIVSENRSALFELLPKEYIPIELGGTGKSMDEQQEIVKSLFEEHGAHFDYLHSIKVDEQLRLTPSLDTDTLSGVQGNFRKLDVD